MDAITQALPTVLAVANFFPIVYLTYHCMHLAPTDDLRHAAATSGWSLILRGPAWPPEVSGVRGEAERCGNRLAPVLIPVAGAWDARRG